MTLVLPRGITGFGDSRGPPSSPSLDERQLKAAIYDAARRCHGHVHEFSTVDRFPRSFHAAKIEINTQSVHVLCNCCCPLIGFSENLPDVEKNFRFCDAAEFSAALAESSDYVILPRRYLDAQPCDESLGLLSQGEMNQVKYHRPSRIGEIIFNYWD